MAGGDGVGGEADEVARRLAPELRVDGEAQAGQRETRGDRLRRDGVVQEHEARDPVDVLRREAGVVERGAAGRQRLVEHAAAGAARERRVADARDRRAGGCRHVARNRSSVQSPWSR